NLIRKRGYANLRGMFDSFFARKILFAIGSVLQIYDRSGVIVWGSGIIREDTVVRNADFRAVRGPKTAGKLKGYGYDAPNVFGDPALLLPLMISPASKKWKVGIVPNYKHYEELKEKFEFPEEYRLIDLRDGVETVTNELTSCEFILATSLHGVIVAHAYSIPALWVDFKLENSLAGDDIKFEDYLISVNIKPYSPVEINSLDLEYIKRLME